MLKISPFLWEACLFPNKPWRLAAHGQNFRPANSETLLILFYKETYHLSMHNKFYKLHNLHSAKKSGPDNTQAASDNNQYLCKNLQDSVQCLLQISNYVIGILKTYRQSYQPFGNSRCCPFLRRIRRMSHGSRMLYQCFGITQAHSQ